MIHPIDPTYITQYFGENIPLYPLTNGHNGIDYRTRFISSPLGKRPCYSPANGIVTEVGDQGKVGYGRFLRIRDGKYEHTLGHMDSIMVKKGQTVHIGQQVAVTDNTGHSTGAHTHWGVREYNSKGIVNYNNSHLGYFNQLPLTGSVIITERTGLYTKPNNKSKKINLLNAGEKVKITGITKGQLIQGNNIWFKVNNYYIWSGKTK